MLTILDSTFNMIWEGAGDLFDHIMSVRIFTLIVNKLLISVVKIMKRMAMDTIWDC
jgi:hypothetical protein